MIFLGLKMSLLEIVRMPSIEVYVHVCSQKFTWRNTFYHSYYFFFSFLKTLLLFINLFHSMGLWILSHVLNCYLSAEVHAAIQWSGTLCTWNGYIHLLSILHQDWFWFIFYFYFLGCYKRILKIQTEPRTDIFYKSVL